MLENLVLQEKYDNRADKGGLGSDYSTRFLKQLNLSHNDILDNNMLLMGLLLQQLTRLQALSLNHNYISSCGLALLA